MEGAATDDGRAKRGKEAVHLGNDVQAHNTARQETENVNI